MVDIKWRVGQFEGLQAVEKALTRKNVVLLDSPVGTGKSIVLTQLAHRAYQKYGQRSYYTTPLVPLANQLEHDPNVTAFAQVITGRRNYECPAALPNHPLSAFARSPAEGDMLVGTRLNDADEMEPVTWRTIRASFQGAHLKPEVDATAEDGFCVSFWPCPRCSGSGFSRGAKCLLCKNGLIDRSAIGCALKHNNLCEYYRRKAEALNGPCATMTLSYLLAATSGLDPEEESDGSSRWAFEKRDLLMVDEAHRLAKTGADELSFALTENTVPGAAMHAGWGQFWRADTRPYLNDDDLPMWPPEKKVAYLNRLYAVLRDEYGRESEVLAENPTDRKHRRNTVRLMRLIERVGAAMVDIERGESWVAEVKSKKDGTPFVTFGPVLSRRFIQERLWPLGKKIVLASGTFGDIEDYLYGVGLAKSDVEVVSVASTFPPSLAPVYLESVATLSYNTESWALPKIIARLRQILMKEPGRGLVHVPSYALADKVIQALPEFSERMGTHGQASRNADLKSWIEDGQPDSVFVGVQTNEGLDLVGDLASWQVIVKAPFPNRKDAKVEARLKMEGGERWYRAETQRALLQALGRIVRSETDTGRTYVLDTLACGLLTGGDLPRWAQERINVADTQVKSTMAKPWLK